MNRAILSLVFAFTLVPCARAGGESFTTGTSLERQGVGTFDPARDDSGGTTGNTSWTTTASTNGMKVVLYGAGDRAYDYEAKGMTRNAFFDEEGEGNAKYLALAIEAPLERCIQPLSEGSVSNVMLTGAIYSDTLVRFTTGYSGPAITNIDKIAVWLRERESDSGACTTNLVITAGRYVGGFDRVEAHDYVLTNTVEEGVWCRLTVCAVTNLVTRGNWAVPGFIVYVDGKPAAGGEDYAIGEGYRDDLLSSEARLLRMERRLFPWLVDAVDDKARSLSRFAFEGSGAVDDILFTTTRPDFVAEDGVFTLQWDPGVVSMRCIVSNATSVVTNDIDAMALPRYRDFALGMNRQARVTVTNVVYDAANEYTNGVWTAQNDCEATDLTPTSGIFEYNGDSKNPIGRVTTTRPYVGVGVGGYGTFAEAKGNLTAENRTLVLMTDLVISTGVYGDKYRDQGVFSVGPNDDLTLDLNGHTLQGGHDNKATILQTGGRLKIVDSAGGGAILPPVDQTIAVRVYRRGQPMSELIVEDGRYEGEVSITGSAGLMPTCAIGGGSFTNATGGTEFYLEQYVTNTSAYYALEGDGYWRATEEDVFVWNGKGEDVNWTTRDNWAGGKVPGVDDLAVFPRAGDGSPWEVRFVEGIPVSKRLWLDSDIEMTGTADFSQVAITRGGGCFVGTGTMSFTNALPKALTNRVATSSVRIGAEWKGTVSISKVTAPSLMTDIDGWGVVGSKVEFAGVRGYVKDRSAHDLPYELVLTDDGATPAWKNETGFTGTTIGFPRLSGTGTFESPANSREVSQVFRFEDVAEFRGKFLIGGKKLVLGTGAAAEGSKVGTFTFSDGVSVRSGLGWRGAGAHFGRTLAVAGAIDDVLMTYTGEAPSVGHVFVTLRHPTTGVVTTNTLTAADNVVTIGGVVDALLDGDPASASELDEGLRAGRELTILAGSAVVELEDGRLIVNGRYCIPEYYKLTALDTSSTRFAVSFDETKATPSLADFAVSPEDGFVVVNVTNAKPGLWYGLRSISSLAESFEDAETTWLEATEDVVTFEVDASGEAAFYQVIVTDVEPY